jgi:hypothetical protein
VAHVRLIFNDSEGSEECCWAFTEDSADVRLADGRSLPAEEVQAGDVVVMLDRTARRVDAVETRE